MAKKITLEDLAAMMKEGFDEIHEKFVTKDDMKSFTTKEYLKIFETKEYMDKKFNDLLAKQDQIIGRLKKILEELIASNGARPRNQDRIDNHEIRIKKLKKLKA